MTENWWYDEGILHIECRDCTHIEEIPATEEQIDKLENDRALVWQIFPGAPPHILEMLISGKCDICWKSDIMPLPRVSIPGRVLLWLRCRKILRGLDFKRYPKTYDQILECTFEMEDIKERFRDDSRFKEALGEMRQLLVKGYETVMG